MQKIKAIIAEMRYTYEGDGEYYGAALLELFQSLEKAVEEYEREHTTVRVPKITPSHVSGVRQISIGGNCVQSVLVTGDGNGETEAGPRKM